MAMRFWGATWLTLLLLFTSVMEIAGHEHAGGREYAARACAVDHDRDHAPASLRHVEAAGEGHEHHCLGCRLGGLRLALAPPQADGHHGTAASVAAIPDTSSRALLPWTGRTNRGPPAV